MSIEIQKLENVGADAWDSYVYEHPDSNVYHLSGWRKVIENTYKHTPHYLIAVDNNNVNGSDGSKAVKGILPLFHMKHFVFGNKLVSIPFFDMGGLLASSADAAKALLSKAIRIAKNNRIPNIDLRHSQPLTYLDEKSVNLAHPQLIQEVQAHKVRMIMDLPETREGLMPSFKSKLRSQIRRPLKSGLHAKVGGQELISDFYDVFCRNMRDLGSPVHAQDIIKNTLKTFPEKTRIAVVFKGAIPVACSLFTGFKDILENPWASSLREYSSLSPNMLLYYTMMEYGCDHGFKSFDFGRSTPGEGTYKFKAQWGAQPHPLFWHQLSLSPNQKTDPTDNQKSKFDKAILLWQKLPVKVTKIIGPRIRKHISL